MNEEDIDSTLTFLLNRGIVIRAMAVKEDGSIDPHYMREFIDIFIETLKIMEIIKNRVDEFTERAPEEVVEHPYSRIKTLEDPFV